MNAAEWDQLWLPLWPLSSNDLAQGVYRGSRRDALQRRYIEANPSAISNLLVVDIDHEDALLRAMWGRRDWLPNAVVESPSGRAHAVWALREPVTRTSYAARRPLAFAAAVTEGLRRSVDGDAGYSGLLTKNPTHHSWHTSWLTNHLYELHELETHLRIIDAMPAPGWRRTRRRHPVGLGRNCSIFEEARVWAYREARRIRQRHEYATPADSAALREVIETVVAERNSGFSEPLPASEARAIAASIHRWIVRRFDGWTDARTVATATFVAMQSARGKRSGAVRKSRSVAIREELEK